MIGEQSPVHFYFFLQIISYVTVKGVSLLGNSLCLKFFLQVFLRVRVPPVVQVFFRHRFGGVAGGYVG